MKTLKSLFKISMLFTAMTLFAHAEIKMPYIEFPMKKGKGMYETKGRCNMCHSWGYTINQGLQSKKFWYKKVRKMIDVFHAPIKEEDIDIVVNYLFENYGNGEEN